ncbi:hypothetical protein FGO68_gene11314 [Halteria grandinella]|uniref:Uncharacterized protein n=1 Tax=Halteria grandinella TaxID=5974 RepID=A0A8J8NNY4_HALGN|nr:hypothetical protein FGO68_gene11314 [Halteria grandinella]
MSGVLTRGKTNAAMKDTYCSSWHLILPLFEVAGWVSWLASQSKVGEYHCQIGSLWPSYLMGNVCPAQVYERRATLTCSQPRLPPQTHAQGLSQHTSA